MVSQNVKDFLSTPPNYYKNNFKSAAYNHAKIMQKFEMAASIRKKMARFSGISESDFTVEDAIKCKKKVDSFMNAIDSIYDKYCK